MAHCGHLGCIPSALRLCIRQTCCKLPNHVTRGSAQPAWKLVLSYEHEIRKKAYHLLHSGDAANLSSALYDAMKNPSLMNTHFILPLNVSAEFMSDIVGADHQVGYWQPAEGKGGKGKQEGKEVRKSILKTKTKEARFLH